MTEKAFVPMSVNRDSLSGSINKKLACGMIRGAINVCQSIGAHLKSST